MTDRILDIIRKLESNKVESLRQVPDQIAQVEHFSREEKISLSEAMASVFYLFQNSDSVTMLKLAIQTENELAGLGAEVAPFLVSEITRIDSDMAAYLGKALARIGKPGLDQLLREWKHHNDNEHAHLNLIQTLSYYQFSDVEGAMPLLFNATQRGSHRLTSMALQTLGRLVEKSKEIKIEEPLVSSLFELAFLFVAAHQPAVRKNAVRAIGQMLRRNLLSPSQKKKAHSLFLEIAGKDDRSSADAACSVRTEAEHFMKYFSSNPRSDQPYTQSFRILAKAFLCPNTCHFTIEAPFIAKKIEAGQFIMVRPYSLSERIPLSICGWDRTRGTIQIIVSSVGKTSTEINGMHTGDTFKDVTGPLGEPSSLPQNTGTSVVIGGGYGAGAIIPVAANLKASGNRVIGIVGARSKENLIMVDELKNVCDEIMITTNDDSCGQSGMVTDALRDVLSTETINYVLAIGPVPMMRAVSQMTRPYNVKTYVSLNAIMVDGTGMCGACRVLVGNETKFACVHGPDFDGHLVDFDNLMKRQKMFVKEELAALAGLDAIKRNDHEH